MIGFLSGSSMIGLGLATVTATKEASALRALRRRTECADLVGNASDDNCLAGGPPNCAYFETWPQNCGPPFDACCPVTCGLCEASTEGATGDCAQVSMNDATPFDGYFASDDGEYVNYYSTAGRNIPKDGEVCKEIQWPEGLSYGSQDIPNRHMSVTYFAHKGPSATSGNWGVIPGALCLEVSEVVLDTLGTTNFWWGKITYQTEQMVENGISEGWMLLALQGDGAVGNTMLTDADCDPAEETAEPTFSPTEEPTVGGEQPNETCSLNTKSRLCKASSSDCLWFKKEKICVLAEGCSIDAAKGKKCKNKKCCRRNGKDTCIFDRENRLCIDVELPENPCDHRGNDVPHSKTSCKNREGCKWNNRDGYCYDPSLEN